MRTAAQHLENLHSRSLELLERGEWEAALEAARRWYRQAQLSIEAERFLEHVEQEVRRSGTADPDGPAETGSRESREEEIARLSDRARREEDEGRWADAAALYDRIVVLSPPDPALLARRENARTRSRERLEPMFRRARNAEAEGDIRTARKIYEELCNLLPWDMDPLHRWEEVQNRHVASLLERKKRRRTRSRTTLVAAAALVPLLLVLAFFTIRFLDIGGEPAEAREIPVSRRMTAAEAAASGLTVLDPADWGDPGTAGSRKVLEVAGQSMAFRWIPPGEAMLGSSAGDRCRDDDERRWTARFSGGFWIGETEVTVAQYEAVLGGSDPDAERCERCPLGTASWHDARRYVDLLNMQLYGGEVRLPFEAEWEYAARAGLDGPYGDGCIEEASEACSETDPACLEDFAWSRLNSGGVGPRPVGMKRANAWGLHDMHGNVSEWCGDWYGEYPDGTRTDYRGPASGIRRVRRGGGLEDARFLRSANRSAARPSFQPGGDGGFRIVLHTVGP